MSEIEIVEVGPRDGLQNESVLFSTQQKLDMIERAIDAGVRRIEVASFVNPKLVPQMADADAVSAALKRRDDVIYIGLVLNKRGALRAIEAGLQELGAVCAASDGFATRNQGQTSEESLAMCVDVVRLARQEGRRAQITISTAFGCPFDGEVDPKRVIDMAKIAAAAGPVEVALADTIGVAAPRDVADLVTAVKAAISPLPVRVHFHNTRNTGLANVWSAVSAGAKSVDASLGGLGGCPFAPRATGNVPTEDVVYMLERSGYRTGLNLDRVIEASAWLTENMGRDLPGMVSRAGNFPGALPRH
ncbi:MAG TPA: hydroxymethylglutaryl-CoA lyase [Steroidobacteraceae bacterium]|jgi:hydroxymethylglutaryl-CoA lyase|nr:hydroxymethylglutaryl-CoA lyase [Steroidobacteraceae bacterium]